MCIVLFCIIRMILRRITARLTFWCLFCRKVSVLQDKRWKPFVNSICDAIQLPELSHGSNIFWLRYNATSNFTVGWKLPKMSHFTTFCTAQSPYSVLLWFAYARPNQWTKEIENWHVPFTHGCGGFLSRSALTSAASEVISWYVLFGVSKNHRRKYFLRSWLKLLGDLDVG